MSQHEVGTVTAIYRFPVKSMQGEALDQAAVWWHGFEGDRRFAFVRTQVTRRFPWLTAREVPALLRHKPAFVEPDDPVHSPVNVTTPDGTIFPIDSPLLRQHLESLAQEPIRLLELGRGTFDSAGISLISHATLHQLGATLPQALHPLRFRANILVETRQPVSYPEETWQGKQLQFGTRPDSALIRLQRPIKRCTVINLDPETAEVDPAVLRAVAQQNDVHAGMYGAPEAVGTIQVGDPILIQDD